MILTFVFGIAVYILILLIFFTALVTLLIDSFRNKVPSVSSRPHLLEEVFKHLSLRESDYLIDLGCGDGEVLRYCVSKLPPLHTKGIEQKSIPYFLAKIRCRKFPNIELIKSDFFSENLSSFSRIYAYLSPEVMQNLEPKILRECAKDTIIVSCDFQFPKLKPKLVVNFANSSESLGKKLYIYVIN